MTANLMLGLPVLLIGALFALGLRSNRASAAAAIASQAVAALLVLSSVVPVLRGSGPLEIILRWPALLGRTAFQVGASGAFFLAWSLPLILLGTIYAVVRLRPSYKRGLSCGPLFALLNLVCVSFILTSVQKSLVFLLGVEIAASTAWLLIRWNDQDQSEKIHITVIADYGEPIEDLQICMRQAGVALQATRDLGDACSIPPATNAIVIFPDEYEGNDAVARITALRAARPQPLILIVTSTPQYFRSAFPPAGRAQSVVVLPKPVFAGTILDAIKARAQSEAL